MPPNPLRKKDAEAFIEKIRLGLICAKMIADGGLEEMAELAISMYKPALAKTDSSYSEDEDAFENEDTEDSSSDDEDILPNERPHFVYRTEHGTYISKCGYFGDDESSSDGADSSQD